MAELGKPQNTIAVLQKYNFTFQKKFSMAVNSVFIVPYTCVFVNPKVNFLPAIS